MAPKHMTAKFAGSCKVCHATFPAGTPIVWASGLGAKHADPAVCAAAVAAAAAHPKPAAPVLDMKPLADFLGAAKARGLRFPKARFLAPGGGELRLSVAGPQSKAPGSIQVVVRHNWLGRVEPDGTVVGFRLAADAAVLDTLTKVAADPAGMAKAYGALMGRCSFCKLALTDAFSVEHGYGPVCAKRWNLEHHRAGAPVLKALPLVA